jgi:hypothetical protein
LTTGFRWPQIPSIKSEGRLWERSVGEMVSPLEILPESTLPGGRGGGIGILTGWGLSGGENKKKSGKMSRIKIIPERPAKRKKKWRFFLGAEIIFLFLLPFMDCPMKIHCLNQLLNIYAVERPFQDKKHDHLREV